jgi:hypothetical protein
MKKAVVLMLLSVCFVLTTSFTLDVKRNELTNLLNKGNNNEEIGTRFLGAYGLNPYDNDGPMYDKELIESNNGLNGFSGSASLKPRPFGNDDAPPGISQLPKPTDESASGQSEYSRYNDKNSDAASRPRPYGEDSQASSKPRPFGEESQVYAPSVTRPFGEDSQASSKPRPFGEDVDAASRPRPNGEDSQASSKPRPFGEDAEAASRPRPYGEDSKASSKPRPFGEDADAASRPRPNGEDSDAASRPRPNGENSDAASRPRPNGEYSDAASRPRPYGEDSQASSKPRPFGEDADAASRPRPNGEDSQASSKPRPFGEDADAASRPRPFGEDSQASSKPRPFGEDSQASSKPRPFGEDADAASRPRPNGEDSQASSKPRPFGEDADAASRPRPFGEVTQLDTQVAAQSGSGVNKLTATSTWDNLYTNACPYKKITAENLKLMSKDIKNSCSYTPSVEYLATITLSNNKEYPVGFSTTIETNFLLSDSCDNCAVQETTLYNCKLDKACERSASSPVMIDHSRVTGSLVQTYFALDNTPKKVGVTAVVAEEVSYKISGSGVFSLSLGEESFLSSLVANNYISGKQFSFDLSDKQSPKVVFGSPTYHTSEFSFVPLASQDKWAINVWDFNVGKKSSLNNVSEPILAEIESTSALLSLPISLLSTVQAEMKSQGYNCWVDGQYSRGLFVCEQKKSIVLPDLTMQVSGTKLTFSGKDLMGTQKEVNGQKLVFTKLAVNVNEKIGLGEPLLVKFYTWFDGESQRIGFAPYKTFASEAEGSYGSSILVFAMGALSLGCGVWAAKSLNSRKKQERFVEFDNSSSGIEIGGQPIQSQV